jgi:hypothetical protein
VGAAPAVTFPTRQQAAPPLFHDSQHNFYKLSTMSAQDEHVVADQEEFDDEHAEFIEIGELSKLGINAADITKLKSAGITTVRVRIPPPTTLTKLRGFK